MSEGSVLAKAGYLDPFGGDSQVVTWHTEVGLGQLRDELVAKLGDGVQVALYRPAPDLTGAPREPSKASPVTIFVSPSSVDVRKVKSVLAGHKADPHYGLSDHQVKVRQVSQKVASGQALSPEEIHLALHHLLNGPVG